MRRRLTRSFAATTSIALSLTACQLTPDRQTSPPPVVSTTTAPSDQDAPDLPRPLVTPGAILTTDVDAICTPGWSALHRRELSSTDKRAVLIAYHLPAGTKPAEWDHLISLELGGDNGRFNVWPEMTVDGKRRKDKLENKLHRAVCRGDMSLADAQNKIVNFWQNW